MGWITTSDGRHVRELPDGRVLHVQKRLFNTILTLSASAEDPIWDEGW
jgi:hypothetical protein